MLTLLRLKGGESEELKNGEETRAQGSTGSCLGDPYREASIGLREGCGAWPRPGLR